MRRHRARRRPCASAAHGAAGRRDIICSARHWLAPAGRAGAQAPAEHAHQRIAPEHELLGQGAGDVHGDEQQQQVLDEEMDSDGRVRRRRTSRHAGKRQGEQGEIDQPLHRLGEDAAPGRLVVRGRRGAVAEKQPDAPDHQHEDGDAGDDVEVGGRHVRDGAAHAAAPQRLDRVVGEKLEQHQKHDQPVQDDLGSGIGFGGGHDVRVSVEGDCDILI